MAKRPAKQYGDACVHFRGFQHDTCDAGVNWRALDPEPQIGNFGVATRVPCHKTNNSSAVCDRCHYPTPEEIEQHERDMEAHMQAFRELNATTSAAHSDEQVSNVWVCQLCDRPARYVTTAQDDMLSHMAAVHDISLDMLKSCTGNMLAHMDAIEWSQTDTEFRDGDRPIVIRSVRTRRRGADRAIWRDVGGKRGRR